MKTNSQPEVVKMTLAEYEAEPQSNRGVWTTERTDLPNWAAERHLYVGKRTLLWNSGAQGTALLIEGLGLEIAE